MSQALTRILKVKNPYVREFFAEFFGIFTLILCGNGIVAQFVFQAEVTKAPASYLGIPFGWGLAVTAGVLISGGVSGGHINPAVTLAMALFGKCDWVKVPLYMIAQYLGAFLAAGLTYAAYIDTFDLVDPNRTRTALAGIWATQPAPNISMNQAFADQVIGTAILLMVVCAITDRRNMQVSKALVPLYVGFTVCLIGLAYGYNAGFAINPARDLSPRLLSLAVGYKEVFSIADYGYWWVPVIGSHVGAIIGVALYYFLVELHWPDEEEIVEIEDSTKTIPVKRNVKLQAEIAEAELKLMREH